jgi:hypothetical protein
MRSRHARTAAACAGSRAATWPSTRSEWPVIAFESLTIERSAPSSSAGCRSGVASVPSTASRAPAAWTSSASVPMSSTESPGFDGVSIQTSVAPVIAARTASISVGTSRTSTPSGARWRSATVLTIG